MTIATANVACATDVPHSFHSSTPDTQDNKDTFLSKEDNNNEEKRQLNEERIAKLNNAATLIQSVYRGYQVRRDLYAPPLTVSKKWRHLIDYSRIEYIHKSDAQVNLHQQQAPLELKHSTESVNRTRCVWRRAEFLSSRLGKGSGAISAEEALVLLTEHWLELSDKKHRYGSNLKAYHECWLEQDTSENFFYWLDKGDGKNVDLEDRPRALLDKQRVQYLQEHERAYYAVHAIDGLLYYKISGELVHTLPESIQPEDEVDVSEILPETNENDDEATRLEKKRIRNKCKYIYVTDPQGTLYIAQKIKGQFHHSSFLGGGTVCAAGGIVVNRGKLVKINPKSGHYRPGQRHFDRLLMNLRNMGVTMEGVKISHGILDKNDNKGAKGRKGSIGKRDDIKTGDVSSKEGVTEILNATNGLTAVMPIMEGIL